MINQNSITVTSNLEFGPHFIKPAYENYCFAHLPGLIQRSLGVKNHSTMPGDVIPFGESYDRVVFMLVDAFGWMFFEKYADDFPFLKEIVQNGTVSRLTSMFPSTTSAHVTCIYTGLPVGQSGVYEWFYYEPKVDMIISPLMYTPAGEKERDLLKKMGIQPADLLPDQTLFKLLGKNAVQSYVFTPNDYAYSTYNSYVTRGAEIIPYITWTEALTNLGLLLERDQRKKMYAFLYFSSLDAIGHPYGPSALHTENELVTFLGIMDRFLGNLKRSAAGKRTLLLMTADHGIAQTDPKTTIYLNQRFPDLANSFIRNNQDQPLLFGGSPRDLFLYILPDQLELVTQKLSTALAGKAEVHLVEKLLQQGFFGPKPHSETLLSRLGNLVILPYQGESVSWYERGRFEQRFKGHHGGLTPEEMLTPLLAYPLS